MREGIRMELEKHAPLLFNDALKYVETKNMKNQEKIDTQPELTIS